MNTIKKLLLAITCFVFINGNSQDYPFKVEVKGKGEPVLLFPGFTCTGEVWEETVKENAVLTQRDYLAFWAGLTGCPEQALNNEQPALPQKKQ